MNILHVFAHPNPQSFNGVIKKAATQILRKPGNSLVMSDLYAQDFKAAADWKDFDLDPTSVSSQYFLGQQQAFSQGKLSPDIQKEIQKLQQADHLLFQFPLWWFSTPAILKGWLDRVLVKGFAYDAGQVFDKGLLKGKQASCIVTTQSPESAYQASGLHGATGEEFLRPFYHTLRFVGINVLPAFFIYGAMDLDQEQENSIIAGLKNHLETIHAGI